VRARVYNRTQTPLRTRETPAARQGFEFPRAAILAATTAKPKFTLPFPNFRTLGKSSLRGHDGVLTGQSVKGVRPS
jgi:hypothetical protein